MQQSLDWGDVTQMVDPIREHSWILDNSGRHEASLRMSRELQDSQVVSTVRAGAFAPPPELPASYESHSSIINSMPLFLSRKPTCSQRIYARPGELPIIEEMRRHVLEDVSTTEAWRQVRESDARRDNRLHGQST
jgi:hypothetical protein